MPRSLKFVIVLTLTTVLLSSQQAKGQVAKLYPVDEAATNPSFFSFRARLLKAVHKRDAGYLVSVLSPNIRNSFGSDGGVAEFRQMWQLDRPNSKVWDELLVVLALGGKFEGDRTFMAPYIYSNFPNKFDAFEHGAIIGENVRVRREANARATVLRTLSFDIVKVIEWTPKRAMGEKLGWIAVELAEGQRGFVGEGYIRSPIDYRAIFQKQGDTWVMTAFIAGD